MTSDAQDAENALLPQAEYDLLAPTRVSRNQWLSGYRNRVL